MGPLEHEVYTFPFLLLRGEGMGREFTLHVWASPVLLGLRFITFLLFYSKFLHWVPEAKQPRFITPTCAPVQAFGKDGHIHVWRQQHRYLGGFMNGNTNPERTDLLPCYLQPSSDAGM